MRYLPLTAQNRADMLEAVGASNVDELYQSVPEHVRKAANYDLPNHRGELEVERLISAYANENVPAGSVPFFLGAGCYQHHIPATADHIIQRSEFLTSYTPYQPEIAQGTLTYIYEFQSYIANLTGQDVANASMYDGATATAEAAMMAMRVKKGRNVIRVAGELHPHYKEVLETYLSNFDGVRVEYNADVCENTACVILQTPDFLGEVRSLDNLRAACDEHDALLVAVVAEIVSLGLLPAPTQADIVVGEAQSVGVPMGYGGPHLGIFACKQKFVRQMPGRLCGMTEDEDGKRSFVLTLNTREQHIRREKATSNICTNQGLMALGFTVHMSLLGEVGFKQLAKINHAKACQLADRLEAIAGVEMITQNFFNEFAVKLPKNAKQIVKQLADQNIVAGYAADESTLVVAATEVTTDADIEAFATALEAAL